VLPPGTTIGCVACSTRFSATGNGDILKYFTFGKRDIAKSALNT
jgi:hypothetical protein